MYKLINIGTQANSQIREYIADTEDDIATLPNSDPFGSTVFVIETSATYMKNSTGEYVEIAVPGGKGGTGGGGVFELNSTTSIDSETGKLTITTDVTAADLFGALSAGKMVLTNVTDSTSEDRVIIRKLLSVSGYVMGDDEEPVFWFTFVDVDEDAGAIAFIAAGLSSDDIVAFTQV